MYMAARLVPVCDIMADVWEFLFWIHQNGRNMHTGTITTWHCFENPSNIPQNVSRLA